MFVLKFLSIMILGGLWGLAMGLLFGNWIGVVFAIIGGFAIGFRLGPWVYKEL